MENNKIYHNDLSPAETWLLSNIRTAIPEWDIRLPPCYVDRKEFIICRHSFTIKDKDGKRSRKTRTRFCVGREVTSDHQELFDRIANDLRDELERDFVDWKLPEREQE